MSDIENGEVEISSPIPFPITGTSEPPKKRGRGRPTKEEVAAREAAENAPDPRSDPFRMYLPKLSAADWKHYLGYLYRLAPITDRRATTGGTVYIGKYSEAVDEASIMREHGSGRYRFDLVFCPPEGGGDNVYVFRHTFDVLNPDYPPKIPPGEWVDDPRNRDWAWAKPAVNGASGQGITAGELADAVVKLTERTRPDLDSEEKKSLQNEIINLVRDNQAQMRDLMDPQKQLTAIVGLMNLLRPAKPEGPDPMMQFLMEERKAQRDEMRALRERLEQRQEPKSFLDQLRELSTAKRELAETLGLSDKKAKGEGENLWADVVREAVAELAPIGRTIVEGMMRRGNGWKPGVDLRGSNPANDPNRAVPGAHPGNALERRRAARTNAPASQPHASGAPHDRPAHDAPPVPDVIEGASDLFNGLPREEKESVFQLATKYGQLLQQCTPFLVDHFRNGLSGYDFRDWFLSRNGSNWFIELKKDTRPEQLINFVKFDAALWETLQPETHLLQFFREFFCEPGAEPKDSEYYLRIHGDDGDEEDDEPPADDPAQNDARPVSSRPAPRKRETR